jgi:hypothetical protein
MAAPAARLPSNRRLILYFVLLAALLPEAITGSTPPLAWLNPIQALLNVWLYGTGVLVVRELSLRWKTGWPGVLLLGAAYGIIEEGLAVTTFFDPTLPQLAGGPLAWYGRLGGVNWVWAVWLTIFHAIFSMAFPIFLIEWHYPALRGRALLSQRGLAATVVLLALATLTINALVNAAVPYRVGLPEYLGAFVAIGLFAYLARRGAGRIWLRLPTGTMPARWVYGVGGFAFFAFSFLVYSGGPSLGGVPAVTFLEGGILLLLALLLVRRTVGQPDADRGRFAFVAGSIAFFATFSVLVGFSGNPAFFGMWAVGPLFLAYVAWLYREKGPEPPTISGASLIA